MHEQFLTTLPILDMRRDRRHNVPRGKQFFPGPVGRSSPYLYRSVVQRMGPTSDLTSSRSLAAHWQAIRHPSQLISERRCFSARTPLRLPSESMPGEP